MRRAARHSGAKAHDSHDAMSAKEEKDKRGGGGVGVVGVERERRVERSIRREESVCCGCVCGAWWRCKRWGKQLV